MVRIRTHANPLQVAEPAPLDHEGVYGRVAPIALDIGCGRGDFALGLARAHPELNVLGLEIRRPLVEHIRERATHLGLANCAAVVADATRHLELLVPEGSVVAVFILHPDPWSKTRHLKRRVLGPRLLEQLDRALSREAIVDFQTDRLELAEQARAVLSESTEFESLLPLTELEDPEIPDSGSRRCRMHRSRGEAVYKLRFARTGVTPWRPGDPEPFLGFDPERPVQDPR